jgi:hypothetical protein
MMKIERITRTVAVIAALQLLFSSAMHLLNPMYFFGTVQEYQLFGIDGSKYIAAMLPFLQFLIGLLLLSHPRARELHAFVFVFGIVFVSAQSFALFNDLKIDCGCFGTFNAQPIGLSSIAAACSLAACGVIGVYTSGYNLEQKDTEP